MDLPPDPPRAGDAPTSPRDAARETAGPPLDPAPRLRVGVTSHGLASLWRPLALRHGVAVEPVDVARPGTHLDLVVVVATDAATRVAHVRRIASLVPTLALGVRPGTVEAAEVEEAGAAAVVETLAPADLRPLAGRLLDGEWSSGSGVSRPG